MATGFLPPRTTPTPRALNAVLCVISDREEQIVVPAAAVTMQGFRDWAMTEREDRRGRIAFLDGELWIDMSPEEVETHLKLKGQISAELLLLTQQLDLGEFYHDGLLVTNSEANLATEPDGTLVTWERLRSGQARLVQRKNAEGQYLELQGSPDWVMEIVSKHSVLKDARLLRSLYFKAGVAEYWLIDARAEAIDFQLLRRGTDDFEAVPAVRGWYASEVFGRRIRLSRRRNRMNYWQYTLHVKK